MINKTENINITDIDLKQILKEVKCLSFHDFSMYAHTFIRNRTERFMNEYEIVSKADLIYRINKSSKMLGLFLDCIYFQKFELFRDAEMWNYIDENILSKLQKKKEIKIHFPYSTGAEELYSFLYILNKYKTEKFKIYVTGVSEKHVSTIKKAEFTKKHLKASEKNIKLLNSEIDEVFVPENSKFKVKTNFKGEIIYKVCDFFKELHTSEYDLVFFQNKMIYFNSELKEKAENNIIRSLNKRAYFIIGEKEIIKSQLSRKIKGIEKNLSIYKRKLFS